MLICNLPEETKDQIRDKINAYNGSHGENKLKMRELEHDHAVLVADCREIRLLVNQLFVKLRDIILKEAESKPNPASAGGEK